MCGIVGFSGDVDAGLLSDALDAIAHRGPDDSGIYSDIASNVGLGHSRLSIIDLSTHGHQPMLGLDGKVILIFNGEIYNFKELRIDLEEKGYEFVGHSDTEVLLNLYIEYGTELLSQLNGIFAIAIWDKRNSTLFLARDSSGVKPLYYSCSNTFFIFASEIKSLVLLEPAFIGSQYLDNIALHRYLSFLWCPGIRTPFQGVKKLRPGEAILVQEGAIQKRWIWNQPLGINAGKKLISKTDAIQGAVKHLRKAVTRQMIADVPVGAFLSGGLDSSAVVTFAKEQNPDIRCFTIDIDGGQEQGVVDDLPYARRVAKHLGVALDVVSVHSDDMAADLQFMITQLDEPLADPACLNILYISRLAKEQGIKVLLSGAGGDDVFSGYRRHTALSYEYLWRWLPYFIRHRLASLDDKLDQRNAFKRRLTKFFSGAELEGNDRITNYFLWAYAKDLEPLYSTEFRADIEIGSATAPMLEYLSDFQSTVSPLEKMLALEKRFFLADHNLNYTDKMSMAAGVEVRVPFLDNDLLEFAESLPPNMKQRGRQGKWVLKKAMEPFLPKDIIYRPKTGFGAPLRRWIQYDLNGLVRDLLSVDSLKNRGLFQPAAVQQLIEKNQSGAIDASYTLFSLMSIEIWCRNYVDNNGGVS